MSANITMDTLTNRFSTIRNEHSGFSVELEGKNPKTQEIDLPEDIYSFFDKLQFTQEYSLLYVLHKMINEGDYLDLVVIFELLLAFETQMFKVEGLSYEPIKEAFTATSKIMQTDYIAFAIEFYRQSTLAMGKTLSSLTPKQREFLYKRDEVISETLISIGKKLDKTKYSYVSE